MFNEYCSDHIFGQSLTVRLRSGEIDSVSSPNNEKLISLKIKNMSIRIDSGKNKDQKIYFYLDEDKKNIFIWWKKLNKKRIYWSVKGWTD